MGQYNQAVITSAGQGLLAGVIASGKGLAFTNAKTSTHIYSSGLDALTDITDVMQTDAVSSATVMSNSQVKISTRFTNEGITAAYDINTIGIFAKAEGDTTDTLFAVITAVTPDSMPKYTASNPVAYIYDVTIGMSNADSITLNVSPTGTPSYGDLAAAQAAAENASASNLAPAYDSTATYAKDDFCVQGGKLYQCNADISTAETFNPAHWTEVKVTEVMGGGGGVTPEIMAQIENAQWKSETSEQLFSETVTTESTGAGTNIKPLAYDKYITADTLTVTFNDTEYTLTGTYSANGGAYFYGAPYDIGTNSYDFSEYPFAINSFDNDDGTGTAENSVVTETPGTYTVSASGETVTYTDTFKKAVQSLGGVVEVSNVDDADVIVLNNSQGIELKSYMVWTINTDGTITSNSSRQVMETFPAGTTLFYLVESGERGKVFSNGGYRLSTSAGTSKPLLLLPYGIQASSSTMQIFLNASAILPSDVTVRYYKTGLEHV